MPSRSNLLRSLLSSVSFIAHLSPPPLRPRESFADRVWNDCRPEALYALYSPFVVALAAGNLDFESYVQYIYQDIDYGKAAVKASELALEYAVDPDAKAIFAMFKKGDEDGAIDSQKWLDEHRPGAEYPINDATKNYKKFLLDTAHGKIEGYEKPFEGPIVSVFSLASFIPCWKLYYFIGKQLVAAIGDYQDNPYKDWIEGNSGDHLGEEIAKIDGVFNKLAASLTRQELTIVEKVYRKGMTCEVEFFLAQPLFQHTSVPLTRELRTVNERLWIFSSFDGTSSVVDSSAILANLAISSANAQVDLKATWGHLLSQYQEEYGIEVETISSSAKKDYNYDTLSRALEGFADVEWLKNSRVIESGALKGIKVEDIKKAGENTVLVQDFVTFFQRITERRNLNSSSHLISSSWSTDLIRAALSSGMHLDVVKVHANELSLRGQVTTGGILQNIVSPANKAEVLESIVRNYNEIAKKLTVYVGQSVEDLLCLLRADVGIVIGPSSSLRRVGTQVGVTFQTLLSRSITVQRDSGKGGRPNWIGSQGILYTVSSWSEMDAFVLGWKNHFG